MTDKKNDHSNDSDHEHSHVILSTGLIMKVGVALLILTAVTVAVAQVNLGWMNFPVAMIVALIKGGLVCLFFMGLKYEKGENAIILMTSVLFLMIFIVLTMSDLLFRPPGTYVSEKRLTVFATTGGPAKFKKPWTFQEPVREHGKELFGLQCVSCHGEKGEGNGVASASLNPKPRNFTQGEGWKRGRKISEVFRTLTNPEGLTGMANFGSLPAEDRWSLAQFVLSLGPTPPAATDADLKVAGVVDPSKDDGGMGAGAITLPIEFAIERMAEDSRK